MYKKRLTVLLIVLALAITSFATIAFASELSSYDKAKQEIEKVTNNMFGQINKEQTVMFKEAFANEVIEYSDDYYSYVFNKESIQMLAMISKTPDVKPLFNKISSIKEAEEAAILLTAELFPKILKDEYVINSKAIGEEKKVYIVDIARVASNIITGEKIHVEIGEYGNILFASSLISDFDKQIFDISAKDLDEALAVEIAYSLAEKHFSEIVTETNLVTKPTPDDDEIVTDSVLAGLPSVQKEQSIAEDYKIFIDEKDNHVVDAFLEYYNGRLCWNVSIYNIRTNKPWGPIDYRVIFDIKGNEIMFISSTR